MLTTFFYMLVRMSLQGAVIISAVLLVRFFLKKLHISHKYIAGLWWIVFFYLVFPWKLSLPVGFWDNGVILWEAETAERPQEAEGLWQGAGRIFSRRQQSGSSPQGSPNMQAHRAMPDAVSDQAVDAGEEQAAMGGEAEGKVKTVAGDWYIFLDSAILPYVWLAVFLGLLAYLSYTYFSLREKLLLCMPYMENIWWAENIHTPMVFGILRTRIYVPMAVEDEKLTYIIAHERMHIRRKDPLAKMLAYVVCLLHWFNPLVWLAYFLFGSDMEKACDEAVIRGMDEEEKKGYAYALLHIASGGYVKRKTVFAAPVCFDEGNVGSRLRNIVKYRYTLPGIGAAVVLFGLGMGALFLTKTKEAEVYAEAQQETAQQETAQQEAVQEGTAQEGAAQVASQEGTTQEAAPVSAEFAEEITPGDSQELPAFYAEDLDALQVEDGFSLEDYHITSRYTASNHFYIDGDGTLWGTGRNEYGQFGTGTYGYEEYYEEPIRIAEQVVSVDASWNDYFCIYLTEDGRLYGMGLNYVGLLLGAGSEGMVYSHDGYQRVAEPVLLMEDVAYARAGRESIVALKRDKTAYWWGQYAPTTHSSDDIGYENYWKTEEDSSNPAKMLASGPMKIMENCKYITTGTFTGAAISEAGELYTWGFNVFGQCGAGVTGDDFIRTPAKVLDAVKMVWVEKLAFSDPQSSPSDFLRRDMNYIFNTFVLTNEDTLLAAGENLGDKRKTTKINGDIVSTEVHLYSDTFVPVRVTEYSESANREALSRLAFGMAMEEAEEVLSSAGLIYFMVEEEGTSFLCVEDSRYYCYFDGQGGFHSLLIQEGGSRDGRFTIGMSLSGLEEAVEAAGGILEEAAEDTYVYRDLEKQVEYEFFIYEDEVSVLWEKSSYFHTAARHLLRRPCQNVVVAGIRPSRSDFNGRML